MTPFTYAFAQYDEPVYSQEVVEVSDDTADSSAGDSSSETWYEENIQGDSPMDFSLNSESQTDAEVNFSEQASSDDSEWQAWWEENSSIDAQNDEQEWQAWSGKWKARWEIDSSLRSEWQTSAKDFSLNAQNSEDEEYDFTGKTVAGVTKMLWWDWDRDSDGYAEALGIENYQGLPEQNEIIRNYMIENKSLPEKWKTDIQDFSESQAWRELDSSADASEWQDDSNNNPGSVSMTDQEGNSEKNENEVEPGLNSEENEEDEWIFDELSDSVSELFSKIRYFFTDEENESYIIYSKDENKIWTITLKDPENGKTITIMDKNLGAENVNDYGYYYQWWNNHWVKEVNSENKTIVKAIYDDSYYAKGYDGNGLFIVWAKDYRENGNHYNNLWWWDLKEQYKQAACPAWYHVPTAKEWNQLMSIWWKIHTQDVSVDEEWQNVSQTRYTANSSETKIASFKDQAQQCEESDTQCVDEDSFSDIINILSSELRLPLAGGYDEDGKYYDKWWIYWTSTAKNGEKALIFDVDTYFGINGDDDLSYKAQGHNIRCFQNVEKSETPMDSSADASEWQGDAEEPHPNPLLLGEGSSDEIGTGEVDSEALDSSAEPQNDEWNAEEWQGDESAKTDSDISVLDYLFQEVDGDSSASPFPGDEKGDLEQSFIWEDYMSSRAEGEGSSNETKTQLDSSAKASEWQEDVQNDDEQTQLDKAWETLNVEPITKADRYNKVTVNVEAPAGTFPEGTYANIRPIVSTVKLDEIKGQISEEDKTVSQESEVVAFDITFLYKLSDGTEVEVQPKENTVKVEFNYEDNDNLSKADENDSQEVKIFHLDNKDENGEKVDRWEEKVVDVTNKQESAEDGIVVADAESFSIYVLTLSDNSHTLTLYPNWGTFTNNNIIITWPCDQENDPSCSGTITVDGNWVVEEPVVTKTNYNFAGWFTDDETFQNKFYFDNPITSDQILYAKWLQCDAWEKPSHDGQSCIANNIYENPRNNYAQQVVRDYEIYTVKNNWDTDLKVIMDRNLWAAQALNWDFDSADASSYGYLYQWWNNYGFESCGTNNCTLFPWWETDEGSKVPYSTWSTKVPSKYVSNKWNTQSPWQASSTSTDNLWWWAGDSTSANWAWTVADRQWPCPDDYYVPSMLDWKILFKFAEYNLEDTTTKDHAKILFSKFLLPNAGYREAAKKYVINEIESLNYWSSSPSATDKARDLLYSNAGSIKLDAKGRSNGRSVRCFKWTNLHQSFILSSDGWVGGMIGFINQGGGNYYINTISEPTKLDNLGAKIIFEGWYTDSSLSEGSKIEIGDTLNVPEWTTKTLYAKWAQNSTVNITFNTKDWRFSDGTQEKTISYILNNLWELIPSEARRLPDKADSQWKKYMFDGWYTDTNLTNRWDGSVHWDITLYAKYLEFYDKTVTRWWVTFTVMDRNLWAGAEWNWDNSSPNVESYWYHYQWWNNYGFSRCGNGSSECNTFDAWETSIEAKSTFWNTHVSTYYDPLRRSVVSPWQDSSTSTDNLWWWGSSSNPDADKQWPCPANYHVPDIIEWEKAYTLWAIQYPELAITANKWLEFAKSLSLPFAGYREYSTNKIKNQKGETSYLSANPNGTANTRKLRIGVGNYGVVNLLRSNGDPVRCFKNTTNNTITFNSNGWELVSPISARWWENINTVPTTPTKEGFTFDGWYTEPTFENEFIFPENNNDTYSITENMTLYAKWVKASEITQVVPLVLTMNGITYTIMDRNLWASVASDGSYGTPSREEIWFYYQWWNDDGYKVYAWTVFPTYDSTKYNWDGESKIDSDMQWPCPTDYHVPTTWEWNSIYQSFEIWKEETQEGIAYCNWYDAVYKCFSSKLQLPFAWTYNWLNNNPQFWTIWQYWSSNVINQQKANRLGVWWSYGAVNLFYKGSRNSGATLRCFKNTPTITFNTNGWTAVSSISARYWLNKPTETQKSWYDFDGWYKENNYQTLYDFDSPEQLTTDTTLYAKWTPVTYDIVIDNNGWTNPSQTQPDSYDVEHNTVTIYSPNKTDYKFVWWNEYSCNEEDILDCGWKRSFVRGILVDGNSKQVEISGIGHRKYVANWTENEVTYSVIWVDYNLALKWNAVVQPWTSYADISNKPSNPTRESSNEYEYTFIWWSKDDTENVIDPTTEEINASIVYKAVYQPTLRKYKVTFKDENGTIIKVDSSDEEDYREYTYNTSAASISTPTIPAKAWDNVCLQYKWSWTPEIADVTWDATYTLKYPCEQVKTYTVTWKNADTVLDTDSVEYQATPDYTGITPTKDADDRYNYIFAGWKKNGEWEIVNLSTEKVTEDVIYVAAFTNNANTYTVTLNPNGWTVSTDSIDVTYGGTYGTLPTDPAREGYEFDGWFTEATGWTEVKSDTTVTEIAKNQTLYAHWTVNTYTVKYYDYIDDVKTEITIPNATTSYTVSASITIPDPVKDGYTFIWWKEYDGQNYVRAYLPENGVTTIPAWNSGNKEFVAQWNVNGYVVIWEDWNGEIISISTEVANGTIVADIEDMPDDPTRTADPKNTYSFANWTKNGTNIDIHTETVTDTVRYKAAYTSTVNKYNVTFVDEDGTVLKEATAYDYGTAAGGIEKPDNPEKDATQQYTYTFAWWTPAVAEVTWTQIYTATYSSTVNKYNVIFVDEDGTVLKEATAYDYGTAAGYIEKPDDPTKEWYRFTWWNPSISQVIENATYTAMYGINQYKITYVLWNGEENIENFYDYWANVSTPAEPTQDGYTFMWWDIAIPATMTAEDLTITAQWKKHTVYGPFYTSGGNPFKIALFNDGSIDLKTTKSENWWISDQILAQFLLGEDAPTTDEWIAELFENTVVEIVNISDLWWSQLFLKFPKNDTYTTKWWCSTVGWCNYYTSLTWNKISENPDVKDRVDTSNIQWPSWANSATTSEFSKYLEVEGKWYMIFETHEWVGGYIYMPYATYTVSFDTQANIVVNPDSINVVYNGTYWTLPEVSRDWFDFLGWFTQSEGWTKVESSTQVTTSAKNQTLYAHWQKLPYTISYYELNQNDEEVILEIDWAITEYEVDSDPITISTPSKQGATFIGWREYVDGVYTRAYLASDGSITIPTWSTWDRKYVALWNIHWYVVVWTNHDDVVLEIDPDVEHGTIPTYDSYTPEKASNIEFSYTFAWWTTDGQTVIDPLPAVIWPITYKAAYTPIVNKYNITFVDGEKQTPFVKEYEYGTLASVLQQDAPNLSKDADISCKVYEWNWPEFENVAWDAIYTAIYTCTEKQKYKITWKNYDSSLLEFDSSVEYGTTPTYDSATPEKDLNDGKTYTFIGWSIDGETSLEQLPEVIWDATYIAVFTSDINTYRVTLNPNGWKVNPDYKVVKFGDKYGDITTPTRDGYTFAGWFTDAENWDQITSETEVTIDAKDQILYAHWTPIEYDIKYEWVENSYSAPAKYTIESTNIVISNPTKNGHKFLWWKEYVCDKSDVNECTWNDWTFVKDWLKNGESVSFGEWNFGNRKFVAQWENREYDITWVNDNWAVLNVNMLEFGEVPTHETPSKAEDDEYTYTFAGWTPAITSVTGPAIYRATYTANPKTYTITFNTAGGSEVDSITQEFWTAISAPADPTRAWYIFDGWDVEIPSTMPSHNMTITAQWKANVVYGPFYTSGNKPFRIALYSEWVNEWKIDLEGTKAINGWVTNQQLAQFLLRDDAPTTEEWIAQLFANTKAEIVNISDLWWEVLFLQFPVDWWDKKTKWFLSDNVNYDVRVNYFGMNDDSDPVTSEFKSQAMNTSNAQGPSWARLSESEYNKYKSVIKDGKILWYTVLLGDGGYLYTPIQKYTVTWKNADTTLETDENVSYGTTPRYDGDEPTKAADAENTYTFGGWSPEVAEVRWNVVYTAQFNSVVNGYTVKFVDEDGTTVLKNDKTYDYGTKAEDIERPANPTKQGYTFAGWTPEIVDVTANATYKATYTINQYTITFDTDGGTTISPITQNYGTEVEAPADPTREGYTFLGWDKTIPATMPAENMTITAKWSSVIWKLTLPYTAWTLTDNWAKFENLTLNFSPADPSIGRMQDGYRVWYKFIAPEAVTAENIANTTYSNNGGNTWKNFNNAKDGIENGRYYMQAWVPLTVESVEAFIAEGKTMKWTYKFAWDWNQENAQTFVIEVDPANVILNNNSDTDPQIKTVNGVIVDKNENFTVSFDSNGWTSVADQTIRYNAKVTAPADPTRYGYTFAGWFKQWATTVFDFENTAIIENTALIAQWTADEHTVTYNNTKWANNQNPATFTTNTSTIELSDLSVAWYTFNGWYDAENEWNKVEEITQWTTANIVLYAQWTPITYNIIYTQVPEWYSAQSTYNIEQSVNIPNPTRDGYTFRWWKEYVDEEYTKDYLVNWNSVIISVGNIGDRKYEAQWTQNTYTVTFQTNGWELIDNQTLTYGQKVTIPQTFATSKAHYDFVGWYTDKALTKVFNVENDVVTSSLTLYAKWNLHTYNVSYANDDEYTLDNKWYTYTDKFIQNSIRTPSKEWYTFLGWSWKDIDGQEISQENWIKYIDVTQNFFNTYGWKDYIFTPHWEINHYVVTFNSDGWTEVESQNIDHGNKVTQPTAPTREWYEFAGWYNGENEYDFDASVTSNLQLKAHWTINQYTITFDTDGGTTIAPITQDYNTAVTAPTDPTKEWYTFDGWDPELPATMPAEDVTVKAKWNINQYTITFDTDWGNDVDPITQDYGTSITAPTDPTKEGYTFLGWDKAIPATMPSENITITAQWANNVWTMEAISPNGTIDWNEITFSNATVSFSPADPNTGRINWYFVWVKFHAPEYITSERLGNLQYSNDWWRTWNNWSVDDEPDSDGRYYMDARYPIDATKVPEQLAAWAEAWYTKFTKTYVFDNNWWSHDDAQSFTIVYKFDNITLTKDWEVEIKIVDGEVVDKNQNYDVTFDSNGGSNVDPQSIRYNQKIQKPANPIRDGYTFAGWKLDDEEYNFDTPVKSDIDLTANWTENTNTVYKVEHYQQNIDNNEYTLFETENLEWTTDTTATAVIKTFEWFEYDEGNVNNITSGNIDGDGSKVLKLYYNRNSYNVTYSYTNETLPTWAPELPATVLYKYGEIVNVAALADVDWYSFVWDKEETSFVMPAHEVEIKWTFTANEDTAYRVKHYQQNIDNDEYTLFETENLEWTTDTDTAATAKTYEWFTAQSFDQVNINWDKSTVVEIKYDRNLYSLSYEYTNTPESHMPDLPETKTYKFWAPITLADAPSMYGYTFGWWQNFPEWNTMPANDVTVKWTWTPVKYTVSVLTKTDAEDSPLWWVVYGAGDYDYKSEVTLFAIPNEWYDFIGWTWEWQDELVKPQVKIISSLLADQTLTAHFQTSEHTVEFDSDWGTAKPTQTIKHWLKVMEPEDPLKEWYTFDGWYNGNNEYDFDAPVTSDLQLKAHWTINQYTITFDTDGGTTIAPITQDYNTAVTAPADPIKDGYTFDGWDKIIPARMPAEDMTITAQWSIAHYGVNLVDDNHSTLSLISHESGEDIQYGETVKVSVLFDDRYQLDSISSNEVTLTKESDSVYSFVMPAWWVVVTLKSKPVEYRIKYNWIGWVLDEGEENPDTYNIENYDNLVLYNPSKQWSIFKWWQLFGGEFFDGEWSHTTQVEIDPDEIWTIQKFTAVWDEESYPITYHVWNEVIATYQVAYGNYANYISQSREWYAFDAWYTDSDCALEHKYNFWKVTWPLHLYARWVASEQTYHVYHKYLKADGSTERTQHVQYAVHTDDYIPEVPRNEDAVNDGYLLPEVQHIRIKAWSDNEVTYIYERAPFTITYKDGNKQIDKKTILYGADIPTMVAPVKEWYTFDDWYSDSELTQPYEIPQTMPADNIVVYAKYDINKHTVRYMDGNRVLQKFDNVEYGSDFPTLSENPSKDGYDFEGWETIPATMPDHDVDIQSIWNVQTFTVTFKNYDGTTLQSSSLAYGQNPSYNGTTPTKAATLEHMYTFVWWDDGTTTYTPEQTLPVVSWDTVYTAVFDEDTSKYTVTFVDEDGETILKATTRYDYQTSVADIIKPTNPTKAATAEYTYTFGGWTPDLAPVTQNVTYVATYIETPVLYTITFVDEDGTEISSAEYAYNTAVANIVKPANPTKAATAQYTYAFNKWTPTIAKVTWDATYTATYTSTVNQYNVTFVDEDGETVIKAATAYDYGTPADEIDKPVVDPVKEWTAQYTYTFAGWSPTITKVTKDVTYRAAYSKTVNTYMIKFMNDDGTTLQSNNVLYGQTPTYMWPTPTKAADAQYTYTFAGWDKEITSVTWEKVYIATYTSTPKQYTITFDTNGWSSIPAITAGYGSDITQPADPEKQWHHFDGWDKTIPETMPAENMTITAQWTPYYYGLTLTPGQHSTISKMTPSSHGGNYAYNDQIQISVSVDAGYTLSNITAVANTAQWDQQIALFDQWNGVYSFFMPSNPVTITTTMQAISYQIEYNLAGGIVEKTIENGYVQNYDMDYLTLTLKNPAREGYTFKWWKDEKWRDFTAGSTTTSIAINSSDKSDKEYTAQWEVIEHTVKYYVDGTLVWSKKVSHNEQADVTTHRPEVEEWYYFDGWYLDSQKTDVYTLDGIVSNTDLYGFVIASNQWYLVTHRYEKLGGWYDEVPVAVTQNVVTNQIVSPEFESREWFKDPVAKKVIQIRPGWLSANEVIYEYARESYLVTYQNAGEDDQYRTVKYEDNIPVLTISPKAGYTFKWWNKVVGGVMTDEQLTPLTTMSTSPVTYKADWTQNDYTITFNVDGGSTIASITGKYGDPISVEDPTKPGYTFAGWSPALPATMPDTDLDVTAQWTINQYTITFDTDGWTSIDPITQDYDTDVEAPADPTKTGYTFAGWNKTIPTKMPAENITIKALWTINQYTITFSVDGGSDVVSITDEYGADLTVPANPTKPGYTFKWWSPAFPETMPAENLTLSAVWEINTHTITFNSNGWTAVNPIQQNYGTVISAPADPTREWYTFAGWNAEIPATMPDTDLTFMASWTINSYDIIYYDTDGSIIKSETYEYDETITPIANPTKEGYTFKSWNKVIPAKMPVGGVTVVAVWDTNEWTLTFDTDGWTPIAAQTLAYGTAISAPANPTKTGYTFAGWNKTIPTRMPNEDVTIKALWTINQYSITFDTDGGSGVTMITQDYNTDIEAPANPTKEGYTFKWWSPALPAKMPAESVSVTAVWEINKYNVVLQDTQNAKLSYVTVPNIDNKFNYGTIVEVSLQVDDGYSFTIGSDDVNLVNKWNGIYAFTMPDKQVTITAESSAKTYDITYVLDGWILPQLASNPDHYNPTVLTLVFDNPTRDGYIFKWWKDETWRLFYDEGSDTTQVRIQDSPLVDKEYTAQWEAKTYLVKFEMENQVVDQQLITHWGYANYVNQSRGGYEFPGWYTDSDFATWTEYNFNDPVTSSFTLYGKFIASDNVYRVVNKYMNVDGISYVQTVDTHTGVKTDDFIAEVPISHRDWFVDPSPKSIRIMPNAENIVEYVYQRGYFDIVYDVNGWTPEVVTQTIMFGTKIPVPADPTREGYTFKWWQKEWTTEILNDNTILEDAHTVTYIAQWKEKQYTITFDTDGWSAIDPITQDYGTDIIAPANPTKDGYTFEGWIPSIPATMPLDGLTVKAQWKAIKYTITFDVDWWTPVDSITQDYDTDIIAPANPTKTGYVFAWWNPPLPAKMPLNGLTVKAQWSLSGYTITFDTDGWTPINPIIQDYDTDVIAPANPTKTGHTFAGWDKAIPAKMPAENITIKALWTVNQYTIIFDTNGWSAIDPITQDYGTPLIIQNPTKWGHIFKWWDPALPTTVPAENLIVVAQWEKQWSSGWWGGWWGWVPHKSDKWDEQDIEDDNIEEDIHGVAWDEDLEESDSDEYVIEPEALSAYEWARKYSITTMDTIEQADPNGYVLRWHLAKMVVNYMVNVLWRSIPYDVSYDCANWNDDSSVWESDEIKDYATKACAFWVMWIDMRNNEFKPNDIVTRAEFGTVVSRILWWDKYNLVNDRRRPRYSLHLSKLKENWIMTQIGKPLRFLELRKWIWVVMKRIQEK